MESKPLNRGKKYNINNEDKLAENKVNLIASKVNHSNKRQKIINEKLPESNLKTLSLNINDNEILAKNNESPGKILNPSLSKKHYYLDECFGRYIF